VGRKRLALPGDSLSPCVPRRLQPLGAWLGPFRK
jgi:hypothetical protein